MSSVQLLDKTRKIGKLLHNNNSSKVVFNDICNVLKEILQSNEERPRRAWRIWEFGCLHVNRRGRVGELILCILWWRTRTARHRHGRKAQESLKGIYVHGVSDG